MLFRSGHDQHGDAGAEHSKNDQGKDEARDRQHYIHQAAEEQVHPSAHDGADKSYDDANEK